MLDVRATVASLRSVEQNILANTRQALGQSAALAMRTAKATDRFRDRTRGERGLRASIVRKERGPWEQFVQAGSRTVRASDLEFGSKAHTIRAKNVSALRFVQAGVVRFAKQVHHPGTKATHFMQSARDAGESALVRFVEIGVNRATS